MNRTPPIRERFLFFQLRRRERPQRRNNMEPEELEERIAQGYAEYLQTRGDEPLEKEAYLDSLCERAYWENQEREARESLAELDQRVAKGFGELELLHNRLAKWLVIPDEDRDVVEFALAVYK